MNSKLKKTGLCNYPSFLAILLLCIFSLLLASSCKKKAPTEAQESTEPQEAAAPQAAAPQAAAPQSHDVPKSVLRASLAGTFWYSNDAETLTQQFQGFFLKADVQPIDNIIALILPHAGYTHSGQTAACGLKAIDKTYKRIIVIGPAHHAPMQEVLSVPIETHYETPLGQIPLDTEFIAKLLKFPVFQNVPRSFKYENSIEMQLPLLQHRLKSFKLVPIAAGHCPQQTIAKAANILKSLIDSETLVVASSDFTHYGSDYGYVPFEENIPQQIKNLDMGAYEYIKNLDSNGFLNYCSDTGATICGRIPIAILLSMSEKPTQTHLIKYTTSGEIDGNYSRSVSYLAVAFSGTWQKSQLTEPTAASYELTEEEKKQLLILARKTMIYALRNKKMPTPSDLGITITNAMETPRAAFITLKKDYQLRGCIGDIFPQQPLYKSVLINTINSCVNDKRFPPVTIDECNDITIEISVLTSPKPIASPEEIRIGIDGVIFNKEGRSAVFLPQIATEYNWNLEQMLSQLCQKASLPTDAWKQGAEFLVFQAIIFGEEEK